MNMLKKVIKRRRHAKADEVLVNDFKRRAPYWAYRPAEYRIYDDFMFYMTDIDKYLKKLFSGEIDDGNGDVLDNMIMEMTRQAEKLLEKQRTEHRDTIKNFDIRRKSDKKAFQGQLVLLRGQLKYNSIEQAKYRSRLEKEEFITNEED